MHLEAASVPNRYISILMPAKNKVCAGVCHFKFNALSQGSDDASKMVNVMLEGLYESQACGECEAAHFYAVQCGVSRASM